MRKIIKNGQIVDNNVTYAETAVEAIATTGDVCVPCEVFALSAAELLATGRRIGVIIDCAEPVSRLQPWIEQIAFVVIPFSKFADGRGYSHCRLLRDRLGFTGEVRARGDVLRDQAFYMRRVGFDAFETTDESHLPGILAGFNDFRDVYQPSTDIALPAWRRHELPSSANA
jgi:uncharacterized protein (DUF934 family)